MHNLAFFSVPSQCILARTLQKKQMLMSVVTKVALQLNCKLGGELWALEIPVRLSTCTYHTYVYMQLGMQTDRWFRKLPKNFVAFSKILLIVLISRIGCNGRFVHGLVAKVKSAV